MGEKNTKMLRGNSEHFFYFHKMKYSSILLLFLLFNFACEKDKNETPLKEIKFEVKNNSSLGFRIEFYYPNNSKFSETNISPSYSIVIDSGYIYPAPDGPSYKITYLVDSATITFSDGKKLYYTKNPNKPETNNPLLISSYYIQEFQSYYLNTFTITTEDYNKAK